MSVIKKYNKNYVIVNSLIYYMNIYIFGYLKYIVIVVFF